MLRELEELREGAAALARGLLRARLRRAQGLPAQVTLRELLRAQPLAASADGLAQASETLRDAQEDDPPRAGRVARLAALRDFLVRAHALALEPAAAQELWDLPAKPSVRPPGDAGLHGALPPVAVDRELPGLRSRDRRGELEEALADALSQADSARGAAFEAGQAALGEAGFKTSAEGACALHARGWSAESPAAAAESLLARTDSLANDLGAWLLERHCEVRAHPGGAQRHDVLHLIGAPRCASAFPRGELLRTARRWAEMLRLDLSAGRAIKLDEEARPLKEAGASAEPWDPPEEVLVTVLPEEGPRALGALLGALSIAQLRAGPPGDAPPEDLYLGDPAVPIACAALFQGLLCDRDFLRRCAKVELPRDDERALAIAFVFEARLAAARTLAELAAHELGLSARTAQAHRELYARAVRAELPVGLALCGLSPFLDSFAEVRGRALAARLRAFLRDRYDEDWWRNPRALPSLQGLWSRGGRPTAAELWAEVGGTPDVGALCEELAAACR